MILSFKEQFKQPILDGVKLHTVRDDKGNRWHAGQKIHFATGVRTKKYKQFKEGECLSTQVILMSITPFDELVITIGNKSLEHFQKKKFIKIEGFSQWIDFYRWFSPLIKASPDGIYRAKLIHWTTLKY